MGEATGRTMFAAMLILLGSLVTLQAGKQAPAVSAAERVVLRDGSVVLGLVTAVNGGPRGGLEMVVRRNWAEQNAKGWVRKWERLIDTGTQLAVRQRKERLKLWQRERAAKLPADDRIVRWIDKELKRIDDPAAIVQATLLPVHLSRGDVRSVTRQPRSNTRLLQLGWLCSLPEVEAMPLDDLKDALEGRGYAIDADTVPSLAGLLPLAPEPDLAWQARRAATELAVDTDLRFIRYQNLVLPDVPGGQVQALNGLNLTTALAEVTRLLDPEQMKEDPLAAALRKIGDSGRVGAVVTRLDIPAQLDHISVETTLWIRLGGDRWGPFVTRSASVRPEETAPGAGQNLAEDPQVKSAFSILEALGLGNIPPELKQRSLKMGAATEQALGTARAAIAQDLSTLMLSVLEARDGAADDGRPANRPADRGNGPERPRR
jgi:hypothetical protein